MRYNYRPFILTDMFKLAEKSGLRPTQEQIDTLDILFDRICNIYEPEVVKELLENPLKLPTGQTLHTEELDSSTINKSRRNGYCDSFVQIIVREEPSGANKTDGMMYYPELDGLSHCIERLAEYGESFILQIGDDEIGVKTYRFALEDKKHPGSDCVRDIRRYVGQTYSNLTNLPEKKDTCQRSFSILTDYIRAIIETWRIHPNNLQLPNGDIFSAEELNPNLVSKEKRRGKHVFKYPADVVMLQGITLNDKVIPECIEKMMSTGEGFIVLIREAGDDAKAYRFNLQKSGIQSVRACVSRTRNTLAKLAKPFQKRPFDVAA